VPEAQQEKAIELIAARSTIALIETLKLKKNMNGVVVHIFYRGDYVIMYMEI